MDSAFEEVLKNLPKFFFDDNSEIYLVAGVACCTFGFIEFVVLLNWFMYWGGYVPV